MDESRPVTEAAPDEPTEAAIDDRRGDDDAPDRRLAATLRQIAIELSTRRVGADHLAVAQRAADEVLANLTGPRRLRWWERWGDDAPDDVDDARESHGEQSPVCGASNPVAPPLRRWEDRDGDGRPVIRGEATLGAQYEGPPRGVHGGWVAAMFDELLGGTARFAGGACVTVSLEVTYRRVTPIEEHLDFVAWVDGETGDPPRPGAPRDVLCRATCHAGETLTAEAVARMRPVDIERLKARYASGTTA